MAEKPETRSEAGDAGLWREKRKVAWLKRICLAAAGLVVFKIILFFTALPKPKIDYVARYNELTKPADFDPEENAAEYYLKACELYIEPTDELSHIVFTFVPHIGNPPCLAEIDPNDLQAIKQWIHFNEPALEKVRKAVLKPYCWLKRESRNKSTLGILFHELRSIRYLSGALIWSAKIHTAEGDFRSAVDELVVCYHVGHHQCQICRLLNRLRESASNKTQSKQASKFCHMQSHLT